MVRISPRQVTSVAANALQQRVNVRYMQARKQGEQDAVGEGHPAPGRLDQRLRGGFAVAVCLAPDKESVAFCVTLRPIQQLQ